MKSPFVKTSVVVGLLLAAGAYYFLVEVGRPPGEQAEQKPRALTLDKAKVKEIEILAKGEAIRLARDAGGWRLTAPLSVAADDSQVESLVSSLETLEVENVVAQDGAGLANFGLDPPHLSVSIGQDGVSTPLRLLVGDEVPAASERYAKLAAEPRVFTIPGHVGSTLEKTPFDLRDRSLLHVERDAVRSIEVTGPEGSYALVRQGAGRLTERTLGFLRNAGWSDVPTPEEQWAFTRPVSTLAARWSVDGLLGNLESLRFESVAAEEAKDLKVFGLDKPVRTVTLGLADGTAKTLEIGATAPDRKHYARDAGSRLVGVIAGALVDDLAKGMNGLRAKRLIELRVHDTQEFDVQEAGTKRTYVRSEYLDAEGRKSYRWKRTSPDAKEQDTRRVDDALYSSAGIDALGFIDQPSAPEAYGLASPALTVVLRLGPGRETAAFDLGKRDGAAYARRSGDAAILKLDTAQADKVINAFAAIESPPPSPSPSPSGSPGTAASPP
jgi:hypothetical protein